MGSIYVHIPFCKRRCAYCNFYSTVNQFNKDAYADAVCSEAVERTGFMHTKDVETLYFGGGTPSQLTAEQINRIYNTIEANFNLTPLKEFTLECNPDDITPSFISDLKKTKVNRISIGIQSFDNEVLEFINRRHTAEAAIDAVKALQKAGYDNISIDLIYGIPHQSIESWKESVDKALKLGVQHISAYNLSFEEGTPIYAHRSTAPDEDACLAMYEYLCSQLELKGFEHYEISNWAKCGYRSKHNSIYWNGGEYLGLGAGAHSYNGEVRCWNSEIAKNADGTLHWDAEKEVLTQQDKYNDLIVTALRTKDGIGVENVDKKYLASFTLATEKLKERGLVKEMDGRVSLTKKGIFVSNMVMREYIEV